MNLESLKKFIKFGITGVMNTLVDFVVYSLLTFGLSVNLYLAQVVGYSCGMVNSYVVNRRWTFRTKERFFSGEALRFVLLNLAMLGLSVLLLAFFSQTMGLGSFFGKVASTCVVMVVNFVANKWWVFRNTQ